MYGRYFTDSVLTAWWDRWGGRARPRCAIELALTNIARSAEAATPDAVLRAWLDGFEWPRGAITPEQARAWLATYRMQHAAARKAALPRRLAGPSVR
eukprot:3077001-Lingulodinium_polyedra.AAC.1